MTRSKLAPAFTACALAALAACSPPPAKKAEAPAPAAPAAPATPPPNVPAGDYVLDPTHASLLFKVSHLGFSNYTSRFTRFDAKLRFDPANPASASVEATIDPASLSVENPPPGFEAALRGKDWLDVKQFPTMTFRSTKVEPTGGSSARVTGDLTLHGVTKPVTLEATFNGGYASHPMDPRARIGFSAHGSFNRSDFGIAYGVPEPGTTMGVGDKVEVIIEAEFTGPPAAPVKAAADAPAP